MVPNAIAVITTEIMAWVTVVTRRVKEKQGRVAGAVSPMTYMPVIIFISIILSLFFFVHLCSKLALNDFLTRIYTLFFKGNTNAVQARSRTIDNAFNETKIIGTLIQQFIFNSKTQIFQDILTEGINSNAELGPLGL